jgi:hypothetical protein
MLYDRVSTKYISFMVGEAKRKLTLQYLCKKHERTLKTLKLARSKFSKQHFRPSFEYVKAQMYVEEDFRLNGYPAQMVREVFRVLGV